jgi:hypothetical protein
MTPAETTDPVEAFIDMGKTDGGAVGKPAITQSTVQVQRI